MRSCMQAILIFNACWLLAVADEITTTSARPVDPAPPIKTTSVKPFLNILKGKLNVGEIIGAAQKIPQLFESLKGTLRNRSNIDLSLDGVCKPEIGKLCPQVEYGNARVAHCLRDAYKSAMHRKEGEVLSPRCRKEMFSVFMVMGRMNVTNKNSTDDGPIIPVDLVPGFAAACESDVKKSCVITESASPYGKVVQTQKLRGYLACLQQKSYMDELTENCNNKMKQVQIMFSRNQLLDPAFMRACGNDVRNIPECREIPLNPFNGKGKRHACLVKHRASLNATCKSEMDRVQKLQSKDVRFDVSTFSSCKKELSTFCKDIAFGQARMMNCLWRYTGKEGFSASCKEKVQGRTKIMMANYTKDFRIASRCKKDIQSLCSQEDHQVHLGGNASKGLVIQCLKKNFNSITDELCIEEVGRVVKIHAKEAKMNPLWVKQCAEDQKAFCPTAKRPHMCLRQNLQKLSPGCKQVEILQGSLEARDISMKPVMQEKCAAGVKKFCKDVPQGDAQVIHCLQKHYHDKEFPAPCSKLVEEDLRASQNDLRLKFGVARACKEDAEKFCFEAIHAGGAELISCLRANLKDLINRECKAGIARHAKSASENIKADPVTYQACVDDVAEFCSSVSPGQGRVHKCLVDNKKQLSQACAIAEFEVQAAQAEDASLNPMVMKECATAIKEHCKDVQTGEGAMWNCLEKTHLDQNLPTRCRKQVVYHIRLKNSELHLNPALYQICKSDFETHCEQQLIDASDKSFLSDGAAINCLIAKRDAVKNEECKKKMFPLMQQRIRDIKANPEAHDICKDDIGRFCVDTPKGPGKIQKCLHDHIKELDQLCAHIMGKVMQMKSEDIRLRPELNQNCKSAIKKFCENVPNGKGKVEACLMEKLHDNDMPTACKASLEKDMVTRSKTILLNPVLLRACKGVYEKLRDKKLCKGLNLGEKVDDITTINPATILRRPELHGRIRQCLLDNRLNITFKPRCKYALTQELGLQANDIRANLLAKKACDADMLELCEGIPKGRGHWLKCLTEKMKQITSKDCLTFVQKTKKAQREDWKINPAVKKNCLQERQTFCKGIERGEGRVLKCLTANSNETSFSALCKSSLTAIGMTSQMVEKKMGYKDIMNFLQSHANSTGGAITGAIAGSLVAISLIIMCFFALRKGIFAKNGYAVVPRALDA